MTADPPASTGSGRAERRAIAAAVVVLVPVLAVIGWLVWPHPSGATTLYTGTDRYAATVTVARPRVGDSDVTVALANRAGAPVGNAAVQLQATQPLMGLATPAIPATSTGTGRYTASGVPLMMTGPWQLRLTVTGPAGDTEILQVPLTVTG